MQAVRGGVHSAQRGAQESNDWVPGIRNDSQKGCDNCRTVFFRRTAVRQCVLCTISLSKRHRKFFFDERSRCAQIANELEKSGDSGTDSSYRFLVVRVGLQSQTEFLRCDDSGNFGI